ncbi:MAG TPA: hypothetical protein VM008_06445 [Phycisphaerae bacterium]|nr:hypothetical protein [Phycisphaerae bacterium]
MTRPAPAPLPPPTFNSQALIDLYRAGRTEEMCEQMLNVLQYFRIQTMQQLDGPGRYFINSFLKNFLFIFTQPDFRVPERFIVHFVDMNRTICNLVSISSFKNTDPWLEILRDQTANFVQVLTLYNARNTVKFDRKALFDLAPEIASRWYLQYASIFYSATLNELEWNNLKEHFEFSHPNLFIPQDVQEVFFGATYIDGKVDTKIKTHVNASIQRYEKMLPRIVSRPNPKKIAVLCANWKSGHSVYRNYYHYLKALKEKYHLTFFELGQYAPQETSLFDETYVVNTLPTGQPNMSKLGDNDYQVVIYPDVGMCMESILLANRRIAPIQLCWPGHSVSTWGADMDYYVSGKDVELPENPEVNYSERLVLIPGMGVIHNKPTYKAIGGKPKDDGRIIINCSWNTQKVNYPFVLTLKKLIERSKRPIVFRLFIGYSTARANDHIPFVRDLRAQLGEKHVEVLPQLDYERYMNLMEEGHFSMDSFHFGGCNTISDSLWLRLPTISWEGTKWYNRIGPEMLRLVGMKECTATTEDEYLNLADRMIHDDAYRAEIHNRLLPVDLDATIYSTEPAKYFLQTIDYLIANHDQLKKEGKRDPIYIG